MHVVIMSLMSLGVQFRYPITGRVWGTVPHVGNVAQPPLAKASGEPVSAGRTHTHG